MLDHKACCADLLLPAKFDFFVLVANCINWYLIKYQTDAPPMVPFRVSDWDTMLRDVMIKVLKPDVYKTATANATKMSNYELKDSDLLDYSKVDIGFSAEKN